MKIFFIRHGETTGDLEDRYGGIHDDSLSEAGKEKAAGLGQKFKEKGIEVIYTSPLARAQETAAIISQITKSPIVIESGLSERNQYGILTGMIKSEAKLKYPQAAEDVKEYRNTIEGAETYDAFGK
jgi:broad specificity phosphatase PhoE